MLDMKKIVLVAAIGALSGCVGEGGGPLAALAVAAEGGYGRVDTDKTRDYGQGADEDESLSNLVAGIWVDPNGCDHWIIDDGIEGYLSQRLDKYGKPVCSGTAPPTVVTGPFRGDETIDDTL
ncbi:hypothetical protein [Primorskyibacter sp. S187A]|uniref:hypothetical protein n=1 Tax=Primorskyibacter sp. S187A TaxID=3415130 RepID=UPI003C7C1E3B